MFGAVIRKVEIGNAASDDAIEDGWKWLCQDWSCPSHDICAKHFGLSERYAAMRDQPADEALLCPTREGYQCRHFVIAKRDYFSESLGKPPAWVKANPPNSPP
jgi:hypothetical protein